MTSEMTLTYHAKLKKEKEGYSVSFRDLPNVFSEGDTKAEALLNAQEALDGVLLVMMQEDFDIAYPSNARKNEYPVPVSPDIAAPILLHLLRNMRSHTLSHVAKAMDVSYQQYQRLEHNCNMTLKSLKRAAHALGGRVEIKFYTND
jgi:antitoxin HicB